MVDCFQFADDVQTDFWELILEEVQEKREEVLDGRLFAEEGRKAGDLVRDRSANVLRAILAKVPYAGDDTE